MNDQTIIKEIMTPVIYAITPDTAVMEQVVRQAGERGGFIGLFVVDSRRQFDWGGHDARFCSAGCADVGRIATQFFYRACQHKTYIPPR